MKISLVVVMAENRVIGRGGGLPWRLPKDVKHFKRLTTGHVVIMGRKTFESIGRPLPKRRTVVITRNPDYRPDSPRVTVAHSLDEGLAAAAGEDEVFVVGGAQIYAQALPRAERLYLTQVHAEVAGDVGFPALDEDAWELCDEESHPADERHAHAFSIRRYERRRPDRVDP